MSTQDLHSDSPRLHSRDLLSEDRALDSFEEEQDAKDPWLSATRLPKIAGTILLLLLILGTAAFFGARIYLRNLAERNLPQLDGSLAVPGLSELVNVRRDARGVPHIHAANLDDLVFAEAFVTTSDRLFQMDLLRRHAAGELAEIFGESALPLDRLQRTLQVRAAADRAAQQLPPAQLHLLEAYARGVNASIDAQRPHLPLEFRLLGYKPAAWTPRDSILVSLAMFQDLTSSFPAKLARESLSARLPPELVADLYPVGSWRDHPPSAPIPDLTIEGPPIEQVPLDESQSRLVRPTAPASFSRDSSSFDFTPGSNNWVVSGAHTASGKPLLSNDMHLSHSVPGIWYEADLEASNAASEDPFHAAGVTIPGLPLIVVGHNAHIAWGFTNLGADVQDLYIETTRGSGSAAEYQSTDGTWQPILHLPEPIRIKGGKTLMLDVLATRHGSAITPILPASGQPGSQPRTLALRWTIYDPAALQLPTYEVDSAHDWPSFLAAFAHGGLPAQNVVYADDQGHIGYHAVGSIPLRGAATNQAASAAATLPADIASPVAPRSPQSPVIAATPNPLSATDLQAPPAPSTPQLSGPLSPIPIAPTAAREWSGYIPFDQLPQVFDPPGGILATANARTTPDDYRYPITLNWAAPYRVERIWKSLAHRSGLKPEDMLALENDVYSDFDHVLAQRLAYALDSSLVKPVRPLNAAQSKTLHQAADLLRTFNGRMTVDSPAAAIVATTHAILWPMLLAPHVDHLKASDDLSTLYNWGEKDYALEQILMHTPPRWLPRGFANWNDFLSAAIARALSDAHAPSNLATWRYGSFHVVDIEHPIFERSPLLRRIFALPTGTGPVPQSGDGTTVKQVGRTFGPSERLTVDLANLNRTSLNLVLGQSGNPASPWFLDQFPAWSRGSTYPMPFTGMNATHTLTLTPQE